jgi:hypothetical protein
MSFPGSDGLVELSPSDRPPSEIPFLAYNAVFASDLAKMHNPAEKWRALVTAISTNRDLEASVSAWSKELPYRSFSSWWKESPLGKEDPP